LPDGLIGFCVEVIIFLGVFIIENLERFDELIDFSSVHPLLNIILMKIDVMKNS
jgi:hypothetical protein